MQSPTIVQRSLRCAARLLLIAPCALFILGCSTNDRLLAPIVQSGARFEVRRGRDLLSKNQIDWARSAFSRAVDLDPQNADAHAGLGEIAVQRKDHAAAVEHFRSAVKYDPGSYNYAITLADFLRNGLGEFGDENAINSTMRAYDYAHHLQPDRIEPLVAMAMCQRLLGEYDVAMKSIQEALRINPSSGAAHNEKASIYQARAEYRNALAEYHQALELNPNDLDAHNGCGEIYTLLARSRGTKGSLNREQALAHFRRSLQISERQPRIREMIDALAPYEYRGVSVSEQGK